MTSTQLLWLWTYALISEYIIVSFINEQLANPNFNC